MRAPSGDSSTSDGDRASARDDDRRTDATDGAGTTDDAGAFDASDASGDPGSPGGPDEPGDPAPARGRLPRLRAEALAAAEVLGLTSLAFARPVLDAFGRSPETFLARDADRLDVVLFGVIVVVAPPAIISLAAAATRLLGSRARAVAHLAVLGVLAFAVVARFATDATSWGPVLAGVIAAVGALALVFVRWRAATAGTYLRWLGAASVVFLVQFLVLSPTASLGDPTVALGADEGATAAVLAGTDDDPPPIVTVVVDGLSTSGLLDGTGRIDAELYPNLAAFADDATFYRNHSTVNAYTYQAVPALLTGTLPTGELPDAATYPDNFFTLFGGTHDVHAVEQITRLCPGQLCPPEGSDPVHDLLGDAAEWWRNGVERDVTSGAQILPEVIDPDRGADFERWIAAQDFSDRGEKPGLWFHHVVLPHEPWTLLPDTSSYADPRELPYGAYLHAQWTETGAEVALQRHVLQTQALDTMLGDLFARLDTAGVYDDALVVVVGDHGQAYVPEAPLRGLAEANYEQVAWTPLMIKAPGQDSGAVDDRNLSAVDVLPTIAEQLGIELDWEIDGVPAAEVPAEPTGRRQTKRVVPGPFDVLEPGEDGLVELDADAGLARVVDADLVPGEGPDAVWQRTDHSALLRRSVDELDVGSTTDAGLSVRQLDRIENPGDDDPAIEVIAPTSLDRGATVALAVNGTVAAVAPVTQAPRIEDGGGNVVHALLMPDPIEATNDLTAYLVTGPAGAETLRPLAVTGG
jgi:hypothetical protein